MMILQYACLALSSLTTSFVPRLIPVTIWFIVLLQNDQSNSFVILGVTLLGTIVSAILMWYFSHIVSSSMETRLLKKIKESKESNQQLSWIEKIRIAYHNKLHTVHKPLIIFWVIVLGATLPVPDILIVYHLQKKTSLPLFVLAHTIGKIANYAPIIFAIQLGKTLM